NTKYDLYLQNCAILYPGVPPGQTAQEGWIATAYDRYCASRFWLPRPSKKLLFGGAFPLQRKHIFIRNPHIIRWFQFNRPSRVYGGCVWFQGNHKAIDRLLDDPSVQRHVRYYRERHIPEESLFHTVLCSQPDLR